MNFALVTLDERGFYHTVPCSLFPLLVDFSATWCPACQELKPVIQHLAQKYPGRVYNVDSDASGPLLHRLGVTALPTVILYSKGGIEAQRLVGIYPEETYSKSLEALSGVSLMNAEQERACRAMGLDPTGATSFNWQALLAILQTLIAVLDGLFPPTPPTASGTGCDHQAHCVVTLRSTLAAAQTSVQHLVDQKPVMTK